MFDITYPDNEVIQGTWSAIYILFVRTLFKQQFAIFCYFFSIIKE